MPHIPRVQCNRRAGRQPWFTLRTGGRLHYLGVDMAAAYKKAAGLLADVPAPSSPKTVGGLIVAWLADNPHPRHAEFLRPWARFEDHVLLADFGDNGLLRYVTNLKRRRLAPWTIRKYVRYASRVVKWAIRRRLLDPGIEIPTKLPKPLQRPRDVSDDVLATVFADMPPHAKAPLSFMLATGCRPSEAASRDCR